LSYKFYANDLDVCGQETSDSGLSDRDGAPDFRQVMGGGREAASWSDVCFGSWVMLSCLLEQFAPQLASTYLSFPSQLSLSLRLKEKWFCNQALFLVKL
jgi:hypothetical protein